MKRARALAAAGLALAVGLTRPARAAEENPAGRVIVLANAADPDSVRIARHYAAARAVPRQNVISLNLPRTETIGWREFVALLWQPLIEELVREKWIDAMPMALVDSLGRRKYAPNGHRMAALVVCRGVPLKITHEPEFAAEPSRFTTRPELQTNAGAVDGELALLPTPNYNVNAFVPNPLFQAAQSSEAERQVVRVSRLDGPTAQDAIRLVDHAISAERVGLLGRAYVDLSDREAVGNEWLSSAASQLVALGFDTDVDRAPATMPRTARCDAPALYFGWYAGNLDGPFELPGFMFPPGAIALHIHSYSATTLRSVAAGWTGPLVARGVTATVGNVNEPYLQFTHRPDLLVRSLGRGATLAEAAYHSLNVLSWQAVLIGDPLYRPFKVSLDQQVGEGKGLPSALAGYAILRHMRDLEAAGRREEARQVAQRGLAEAPNLALAFAWATRCRDAGDIPGAVDALAFAVRAGPVRPDEWALAAEAARLLESCGAVSRALKVWAGLLDSAALPRELKTSWLVEGINVARAAGETARLERWKALLTELTATEKKQPAR